VTGDIYHLVGTWEHNQQSLAYGGSLINIINISFGVSMDEISWDVG
jgi:hypothetical protein